MTTLTPIPPQSLDAKIKNEKVRLIDVREADEYAREHIEGAQSYPLSSWTDDVLKDGAEGCFVFMCRSGMRTDAYCATFEDHLTMEAFKLEGGLEAWKKAGFKTIKNAKAPLEINRQVQIIAGSIVLLGVILANTVHPHFIALPGFIGAGLVFAGLSGWCGMATMLKVLPWNKTTA